HHLDLLLIEGVYYFANDDVTVNYRSNVASTLANWITNDLELINRSLLDKSNVYFYPKTTFGTVAVVISDGLRINIPAGQSFNVTLHVPSEVYSNDSLKEQLRKRTVTTIAQYLKNETIAISDIVRQLREAYGQDVI